MNKMKYCQKKLTIRSTVYSYTCLKEINRDGFFSCAKKLSAYSYFVTAAPRIFCEDLFFFFLLNHGSSYISDTLL